MMTDSAVSPPSFWRMTLYFKMELQTYQTAVTLAPAHHLFAPEYRNIFMDQVAALEKSRHCVDFSCDSGQGHHRRRSAH
nr:hypothetical protein [uncultured Desulfobacter sp.]